MQNLLDNLLNGPSRYTQEQELGDGMTVVVILGALAIEIGAAWLLFRLAVFLARQTRPFFSWILRRFGVGVKDLEYTFLQLTFPYVSTKSAYATEQLHVLLQTMSKTYGFWDRRAAWKRPYSLELVASKDSGIRYVIRVPAVEADVVRRTILSFLLGIKIAIVDDYMKDIVGTTAGVIELKLKNDYLLPLNGNKAIAEHDPIAYLSGHMRQLAEDELVAVQIVAIPVYKLTHSNEVRRMQNIRHRIALNKSLYSELTAYKIDIVKILLAIVLAPFWVIVGVGKVLGAIIEMFATDDLPASMKTDADKRSSDDPYEKEIRDTIKTKLDQQRYEISLRILAASPDNGSINQRPEAIVASFETFTSSRQFLRVRKHIPLIASDKKYLPRFTKRELSRHIFSQPTIVSASELADLYTGRPKPYNPIRSLSYLFFRYNHG